MGNHTGHKKVIEVIIKVCIFTLLFFAIYKQVFRNKDASQIVQSLQSGLESPGVILLLMVGFLMTVNWGIEAWKWRLLMEKVEPVRYGKSVLATFSGITFTLFTPNRIGEYGGRLLFLKNPFQVDAVIVTILGSVSQIVVTLTWGMIAFFALPDLVVGQLTWSEPWMKIPVLLIPLVVITGYFNIEALYDILKKVSSRTIKVLQALKYYTKPELLKILMFSQLRYLVYCLQYILLFYAFGIDVLNMEGLLIVAFIFFVITIVPSIAALELGIRGNVALFMLGSTTENEVGIIAATFCLWFINLVIPAVVGYVFILSVKIFKGN